MSITGKNSLPFKMFKCHYLSQVMLKILFFIFLISSQALASFRVLPELKFQTLDYADPLSPAVNQHLWSLHAGLLSNLKFNDHFKIRLNPIVQASPTNKSSRETFYWDLPEGFLEYKNNNFSVQAGENIFNWSGTDGYNPVDVVSARRYFDPIRAEKIGAPSIAVRQGVIDFFDGQFIFIPQQAKSQLPGENSRWLPRDIYVPPTSNYQFNLPPVVSYSYLSDLVLDNALANNFGARLEFHIKSVDLSLVEFEGASLTPAILVGASGQTVQISSPVIINADPDISLQPVYFRQRTSGVTLVAPINETIFRLALSYTQPISKGPSIPGWSYSSVFAVERSFSIGRGTLTLVPQYSNGQHQDSAGNEVTSLSRLFDRAFMLGTRYAPSESWSITPTALYDTLTDNKYYDLEILHTLTDQVSATIAGEIFAGKPGTMLGSYQRNSRASLSFIWHL
jgi:hypothetical protein